MTALPARMEFDMAHTRQLWREQPGAFRAWLALSIYNVALGLVLALGGASRVSGPSFALVRDLGGPVLWGAGFVGLGAVMLAATLVSPAMTGVAFLLGSAAHAWFAAQFVATAVTVPYAGITGCVTYLLIAFWHASLAVVYRAGAQKREPR